ncbi:hypothetical protein GCM10017600_60650 [Streptosporangium carneum]|uniref:Tn3 transposase DDE domain-containing protein n=2 Tax=Streptosporangium carneum TaxID=47481 RepID=A0A9W6MG12_9ACTN|nr:hypothetical protein GCM10017600_60650 [Streptosporangium carneum]
MSSSDGQRFPVRGKSLTARDMNIHGGRVLSTCTHVSDQWSTYGTKQIVPTAREGRYTLDEMLGDAEVPLQLIMAKTRHKNPRTAMRCIKPGSEAVAEITSILGPPRRTH